MDNKNLEVIEKLNHKYKDYYLYETHLHTSQGSACGKNTGREMALAAKEYGYTGIFVTDHFFYGNTAVDRSLPWHEWVDKFCEGYFDAKRCGDEIGLQVFFGWESCYNAMEFLIYGLSPEWLKSHPDIRDCSVREQYEMIHKDGGLIIQAHPFREDYYIEKQIQYPNDVDGVEVLNISNGIRMKCGLNACLWDDMALQYAKAHNLHITAGSDVHTVNMLGCGMGFEEKLETADSFINAVLNDSGILLY